MWTWAVLDTLEAGRSARRAGTEGVLSSLHRAVPRASGAGRGALLALKRDIHNDRVVSGRVLETVREYLDTGEITELHRWIADRASEDRQIRHARDLLK